MGRVVQFSKRRHMLGNMPQAASCVSAGASDAGGRTAYLDDCFDLRVLVPDAQVCACSPRGGKGGEHYSRPQFRAAAAHRWLNGKCALHSSMWAQEHGAATHRRSVGGEDLWAAASKNRTRRTRPLSLEPRDVYFALLLEWRTVGPSMEEASIPDTNLRK